MKNGIIKLFNDPMSFFYTNFQLIFGRKQNMNLSLNFYTTGKYSTTLSILYALPEFCRNIMRIATMIWQKHILYILTIHTYLKGILVLS